MEAAQPEGPRVTRRRSRLYPPSPAMVEASASSQPPANDMLQAVHGALLSVKPAHLDGASLTSKVMARVPEALRECYPLTWDDCFVSTYDKWAALYKSMQKTVTVDQANIDQLRKSYSERLIIGLGKFAKVFTHLSNPIKEFGGIGVRPR